MQRLKIETIPKNGETKYEFEIPWEWITQDGDDPNLEDLEASANRGKLTGYLYRKRMAEVPHYKLKILKHLKQSEVFPFLRIIRKQEIKMTYFEKYENDFVKTSFYVPKPSMPRHYVPKDNNTDNIVYAPFEVEFIGFGDVNS